MGDSKKAINSDDICRWRAVEDGEKLKEATAGITDAIAFGPDGAPRIIVDWKGDVVPTPETLVPKSVHFWI
jgi:hypothetical protein